MWPIFINFPWKKTEKPQISQITQMSSYAKCNHRGTEKRLEKRGHSYLKIGMSPFSPLRRLLFVDRDLFDGLVDFFGVQHAQLFQGQQGGLLLGHLLVGAPGAGESAAV